MDGFKAFKYMTALKLHFTTEKYDVFETGCKVKGSRETFEKRNDRKLYELLADKFPTERELIQFIVANLAYGHRDIVYSSDSDDYYQLWTKRKESITQVFRNDLSNIVAHFAKQNLPGNALYSIESGMPELLNLYLGGRVSLETMVILQRIDNYLEQWEPLIMLWHNNFLVIRKVNRFVKFKMDRVMPIYENFKEELEFNHGS